MAKCYLSKITVKWIGLGGHPRDWFYWNISRFNSGYPYDSYRVGPFLIKKWWK